MSNAKRVAILFGIGLLTLASSWILGGCGNPNNVVPQAPIGGAMVGGAYGTCYPGYVQNGNMCTCSAYYSGGFGYGGNCAYGYSYVANNNGYYGNNYYGNGYGYGNCPAGTIMCSGQCYSMYTYGGYCPPGTIANH